MEEIGGAALGHAFPPQITPGLPSVTGAGIFTAPVFYLPAASHARSFRLRGGGFRSRRGLLFATARKRAPSPPWQIPRPTRNNRRSWPLGPPLCSLHLKNLAGRPSFLRRTASNVM